MKKSVTQRLNKEFFFSVWHIKIFISIIKKLSFPKKNKNKPETIYSDEVHVKLVSMVRVAADLLNLKRIHCLWWNLKYQITDRRNFLINAQNV